MLQQQVLDFINQPGYKPFKLSGLAKQLAITKQNRALLREVLDALKTSGEIIEDEHGLYRPRSKPGTVSGVVKRISNGSGFLTPHDSLDPRNRDYDIFIAPEDMHDAHSGDEVLVQLTNRRRRGGQKCGLVLAVTNRASNTFVGTYYEKDGIGYVRTDGKTFESPITVGDPGAKGARPDDKVVIEMLRFPGPNSPGEAVLTTVLGPRGQAGVDTLSIIHEFNLIEAFPDAVQNEARLQAERFDDEVIPADREDFTKDTIITIDPATARDFDDAISLKRDRKGYWRLGVHIADVSHFVETDSPLDQEARRRGTSVYLPERVIPMLPELLSNGLASLQQGKIRYVKSAIIDFTAEGVPIGVRFANGAIKVSRRFAYEEVMPIVQKPEDFKGKVPGKIRKLLIEMHELAMLLRKRRFAAGALELFLPEIELEFDEQGKVSGAGEAHHDESHEIIEEFMLAANIAVASELNSRGIPFLRRIHPPPHPVKLKELAQFVNHLGYEVPEKPGRSDLQKLVKQVHGTPLEKAVNYSILRSMKQAQYSPEPQGHYALAEEHYCHFTSPIRRYPDLLVHRLIGDVIRRGQDGHVPGMADLVALGNSCTATEKNAEAAERELTKLKLLTYMQGRVGEEFDAIITGVERYGLFCQCEEIPAEGLARVETLPNDRYYHDPETLSLIGQRRGLEFRLGDRVRIKVIKVDLDRRDMDLQVLEKLSSSAPKKKKSKKKQGKGKKVKPDLQEIRNRPARRRK